MSSSDDQDDIVSYCANQTAVACYDTDVSGDNIVTSIYFNLLIGFLCLCGFILWRGSFEIYFTNLVLPGVRFRPPKMKLGGWHQLWSWAAPIYTVKEKDLLQIAGIDALVAVRILQFGVSLFLPMTVFCVGILLPVNYTASPGGSDATSAFFRMTISNIPNGSSLMWIHFVIFLVLLALTCYLLIAFYKEHTALRQTSLAATAEKEIVLAYSASIRYPSGDTFVNENEDEDDQDKTGTIDGNVDDGMNLTTSQREIKQSNRDGVEAPTTTTTTTTAAAVAATLSGASSYRKKKQYPKVDIWPTRRLLDEERDQVRPGRYTVIIRDEQFAVYNDKPGAPFGLHHLAHLVAPLGRMRATLAEKYKVKIKPTKRSVKEQEEGTTDPPPSVMPNTYRMKICEETFMQFFGDDFDCIIPVYNTEQVNKLLAKHCFLLMKIDRVKLRIETAKKKESEGGNTTSNEELLTKKQAELVELERREADSTAKIYECQEEAKSQPKSCFIALFKTQEAAWFAASLNPNPLHQRMLHLVPGVDPENVNWPTLERGWLQRTFRPFITLIFILIIMLLPIGIFTGIFSQIVIALCGGDEGDTGSLTGTWFCSDDQWATALRNIITGVLPSLLLSIYQSVLLPIMFYACAQSESKYVSLTDMELRMASLFFYWGMFNFFAGALLGGTATSGLRAAVEEPDQIAEIIAAAAGAASNFFINYTIQAALLFTFFRLFWPAAPVIMYIFKWFRLLPKPKTKRDKAWENPPRNCRYSRDIGTRVMAVYIATFGYCIISPFIVPCALIYFFLLSIVWKYQMLYVFQKAYDSEGEMWRYFAHRMVACMGLCTVFTSCMFLVKQAYVQAGICFFGAGIFLLAFDGYLKNTYDAVYRHDPAEILRDAPKMAVDRGLYVPPALKSGAKGWYIETGKVWQGWGAPRHSF